MNIYLCVKIHTKTNLKYFCKTSKKDPYIYKGSGIHWLRHINYHGKEFVKTLKVWTFTDEQDASIFALKFSRDNKIVESKNWANLQEENGLDGWVPGQKRPSTTGENNPAKRHDVREKLSKNNPMKNPEVAKRLADMIRGIPKPHQCGKNNNACQPGIGDKISKALKGKPKERVTCPHCGKIGGKANMTRYHFENCKLK